MKTLKQISDDMGVTKNAIVMKLRRNTEFAELLQEHIDNEGNVDEEGEQLIRASIKPRCNTADNCSDNVINVIGNVMNVTGNVSEITKAILDLKTENVRLQTQLTAEKAAFEQRLADKDRQIEELRKMLGEQTRERQAYSAALLSANAKLSEVRCLTLTDRLFGWNNVQAMLTNNSINAEQYSDVYDENAEKISPENEK